MTYEQVDAKVGLILAMLADQLTSGILSPTAYARELASLNRYARIWYEDTWHIDHHPELPN